MEDLVKTRNRKLVELYCMSRLSELLVVKDERTVKTEIEGFLRQNDIRKGLRFRSETLPKLVQPQEPLGSGGKRSNVAAEGSRRMRNEQLRSSTAESPAVSYKVKSELKRPLTEGTAADLPPEKKIKVSRDTRADVLETGSKSSSSSVPTSVSSSDDIGKAPSASIYTSPAPPMSSQPVFYPELGSIPAEPTPLEPDKKFSNYLVDEVSRRNIEPMNYFKENNINCKESVLLLMKEIVPSEIAQALPLAELKYMVQTLPLIRLIPMAHKVLTTDIMNNALSEGRITVVSSRIEELRRLGLWSLRQPKRFPDAWQEEPSHYRTLLEEAKWMQADFKEGHKYKIAACTTMAHAVMEYWAYGKECCVNRRPITHIDHEKIKVEPSEVEQLEETKDDSTPAEGSIEQVQTAEDLASAISADGERSSGTPVETIDVELLKAKPDSAANEVVSTDVPKVSMQPTTKAAEYPFKLHLSFDELNSTARTIAQEIPLYTGMQTEENDSEGLPFIAVSKSLVTLEDDHFFKIVEKQIVDEEQSLVQLSKRRGMFYGNRRSHYLKPPPAPSLRYLQNRTPTIWLPEDDQELVKNINAYAYNWELISAHMTHRPTMSYFSNIERRTPWQCFERFVQLNERFSFSDLKGPRAHSVHQWLLEAHKFQQKQNRRISPLGVGPESIQRGHRRLRWASMFEAIRKSLKKRENAPRPNPTQPRKPLDCKNMKVPTPAEMSQLKAQRDEALRRDILMRRNVKSRLQQQSSQSNPNLAQNRASHKAGMDNADKNSNASGLAAQLNKNSGGRQVSTPVSSQRSLTEREIVESYSRKILAQKPELSLETAMKAAQSYYKSGQQRRIQLQQQQQKLNPQTQASSAPTSTMDQKAGKVSNNHLNPNHSAPNPEMKSPTPQEILERFQK